MLSLVKLVAKDFLRFRSLELSDIPERALVVLSGAEGSGKSAVGRALLYALFGRTTELAPAKAESLIRRGAARASVTAVFRLAGYQTLEIRRGLWKGSPPTASLWMGNSSTPLSEEPEACQMNLEGRLGVSFETFRRAHFLHESDLHRLAASADTPGALLSILLGTEELEAERRTAVGSRDLLLREEGRLGLAVETLRGSEDPGSGALDETSSRATAARLERRISHVLVEDPAAVDARIKAVAAVMDRVLEAATIRRLVGDIRSLEAMARRVRGEVDTALATRRKASEDLADWEVFSRSLDELEGLVRSTGQSLASIAMGVSGCSFRSQVLLGKEATPEALPASQAAGIEAESAAVSERLAAEQQKVVSIGDRMGRTRAALVLTAVVGLLCVIATGRMEGLFVFPLGVMAIPTLAWMRDRQQEAERRVAELGIQYHSLKEALAHVLDQAARCDRLSVRERSALLDALDHLEPGPVRDMATLIGARHPALWGDERSFYPQYGEKLASEAKVRLLRYLQTLTLAGNLETAARESRQLFQRFTGRELDGEGPAPDFSDKDPTLLRERTRHELESLEHFAGNRRAATEGSESIKTPEDLARMIRSFETGAVQDAPDCTELMRIAAGQSPEGLPPDADWLPWVEGETQRVLDLILAAHPDADLSESAVSRVARTLPSRPPREPDEAPRDLAASQVRRRDQLEAAGLEVTAELSAHDGRIRRLEHVIERRRDQVLPRLLEAARSILRELTDGRLVEPQVDPDGALTVEDTQAKERIGLGALPSGQRRTVCLGLRLAMAVASGEAGEAAPALRLVFLDAPVEGLDETRARAARAALVRLQPALGQILLTNRSPLEGGGAIGVALEGDEVEKRLKVAALASLPALMGR